jgi:hypothetical protein
MFQKDKEKGSPMIDFYGNNHKAQSRLLPVECIGSTEQISVSDRFIYKTHELPFKLPEEPLW